MLSCAESLTVQHLRGHPVRVSHDSVALPPVRLAKLRKFHGLIHRGRSAAIPLLRNQPSQAKIRHHHRLVLVGKRGDFLMNRDDDSSKFLVLVCVVMAQLKYY